MKKRRTQFIILLVIYALVIGFYHGIGGEKMNLEAGGDKGSIKIGYNNWAESIATAHMWKVILEKKGYDVELVRLEKAPTWAGTASGDVDLVPEVWLPNTDKPYYEKYKDQVELHEVWYKGTNLGLVVPTYMKDINTMEDLKKPKFQKELQRNGKPSIVGIDSGASLMSLTEKAIKDYKLPYNLIESSEPAMLSELDKAIKNKEPIVVTLWNPHWSFSEYDLRYLKDSKNVYGDRENIRYMTRKGFTKDHPEVVKWFNQWEMDDHTLGTLMAEVENTKEDPEQGVRKWMEKHPDLIKQWTK
jgi:glycine betaine/proline transport system substrate-binding protein